MNTDKKQAAAASHGILVIVGRTPWSAAGPLAGPHVWKRLILPANSGSRGTRADRGSALQFLPMRFANSPLF